MEHVNRVKVIQSFFNENFKCFKQEIKNLLNNLDKDFEYLFEYSIKENKINIFKVYKHFSKNLNLKKIYVNRLNKNIDESVQYIYYPQKKYLKLPFKRLHINNFLLVNPKNPILSIQL